MTETHTATADGPRLLPSDYLEQGGWCTKRLTTPGGAFSNKIGVHGRGRETPEGYQFCMVGSVMASQQDGYLSSAQERQLLNVLGSYINPDGRLMRVVDRLVSLVFGRSFRNRLSVPFYNNYVCASSDEALSMMRQAEVAMGLRPAIDPSVSGVRTNVEKTVEVLLPRGEETAPVDERQGVAV